MRASGVLTLLLIAFLSVMIGCGSSNQAANTKPTPSPQPAPAPAPSPQPSPQPSPSPNPGTAQWVSNVEGATGTVTVSTGGDVTVQVTKAMPSTTYVGNFCQFPSDDWSGRGFNPCFAVGQPLVTDASGNGQLTFHFPKSGVWSGAFFFAVGGDTNSPTRIDTNLVGTQVSLSAPLVPVTKANGGGAPGAIEPSEPQEPGSGSVSISGASVNIKLAGATPNAKFIVGQSFSGGGSASQQIGNDFSTDASGNATVSIPALDSTGPIISVVQAVTPAVAGLETGFTVP